MKQQRFYHHTVRKEKNKESKGKRTKIYNQGSIV
jgi:hypothetical protein